MASSDHLYMTIALRMAKRGLGRSWPNPAVGAVVVDPARPGQILGRGWTMPGGRPHAETVALAKAGERARGATLYVTLEPCAHHGHTPPCVDAIIEAGIARVVCSLGDPDARVAGRGFEMLRDHGVEVETGHCAAQAEDVTRGHILRVQERRPEVTLKLAIGADGLIAAGQGQPVWVTGDQARARGHLMRARADAILVGRGTIDADDPDLTCRLPGMEDRSPVRVVLDSALQTPPDASIFSKVARVPVWLFSSPGAPIDRRRVLETAGAKVFEVGDGTPSALSVLAIVEALARQGITRLLVEGGPRVARSFLDAGLLDRAVIFRGSRKAGKNGLQPFVDRGIKLLESAAKLKQSGSVSLGTDTMFEYVKT